MPGINRLIFAPPVRGFFAKNGRSAFESALGWFSGLENG